MIANAQTPKARGLRVRALFICALALAAAACGDTQEAEEVATGEVEVATAPVPDYGPVETEPRIQGPIQPADCNLPRAEEFVGEEVDLDTRSRLLEAVAPITDVRWVGPGDATTDDLRPDRLNVMMDAGDVITDVSCG